MIEGLLVHSISLRPRVSRAPVQPLLAEADTCPRPAALAEPGAQAEGNLVAPVTVPVSASRAPIARYDPPCAAAVCAVRVQPGTDTRPRLASFHPAASLLLAHACLVLQHLLDSLQRVEDVLVLHFVDGELQKVPLKFLDRQMPFTILAVQAHQKPLF